MTSGKPLVWLHGEVKTPPFSRAARLEAGFLLRRLQNGEVIAMPAARPMPDVGRQCYELRIDDGAVTWRIVYYLGSDAVVILEVFQKKTRTTPKQILEIARKRLRAYQRAAQEDDL
ncbi:MAG TPA: type II toxin-antitoxin system RelE/ParE family toxin [Thermoanaerobaculia bacterium]|jgi:phage-related protein